MCHSLCLAPGFSFLDVLLRISTYMFMRDINLYFSLFVCIFVYFDIRLMVIVEQGICRSPWPGLEALPRVCVMA